MFKLLGTKLAPSADIYILIAAALMIPTVWLPDLKALSVLGVFGFAATLVVASTIAYVYIAKRQVDLHDYQLSAQMPFQYLIHTILICDYLSFLLLLACIPYQRSYQTVIHWLYPTQRKFLDSSTPAQTALDFVEYQALYYPACQTFA